MMTGYDPDARPIRQDIANAYRLALGREPEAERVLEDRVTQAHREWLPPFFLSQEFRDKVYAPILRGDPIQGGLFDSPPSSALAKWAADFLPLSDDARRAVRTAADWHELFHSVLSDKAFIATILSTARPEDHDDFLIRLGTQRGLVRSSTLVGGIDRYTATEVHGWAVDRADPERRVELELVVDDSLVASGATRSFRHGLVERYGGTGHNGFVIRYFLPDHAREPLTGSIREAVSHTTIGSFSIPPRADPPLDEVTMVRRELSAVRTALERIEARLPAFHSGLAYPIEAYDDYFQAWYAPRYFKTASNEKRDLAILIDGSNVAPSDLDTLLASIAAQTCICRQILIAHPAETSLEIGNLLARWRPRLDATVAVEAIAATSGFAGAFHPSLARCDSPNLLLIPGPFALRPDAVDAFHAALEPGVKLVYADDDTIVRSSVEPDRHSDPQLRGGFDYDLLLQQNYLDTPLAAPASLLRELGLRAAYGAAAVHDLVLRLNETGRTRIVHLDRILSHRVRPAAIDPHEIDARCAAVADHLGRVDRQARVEAHAGAAGAPLPATLRIRRPIAAGLRAAIVIPTRDRLDMLEPCLASITDTQRYNTTSLEILVVDNGSREPATHVFLDRLRDSGEARVVTHDGPFNWALMNNRAASQTDADILIFLNNDTIAVTPDCWDLLCGEAARPEVGAVGARLLYQDGTIQHAGAVMEGWQSISSHEGMGASGDDAGYLGRHALVHRASTITGACLATRRDLFLELGGFDAIAFPIEGNDTDYCLRLGAEGYSVLYNPYASLYHFESKTRGYNIDPESRRLADEAARTLRARWADAVQDDPFYNRHFDRLAPPFTRLAPP